MIFLVIMVVAFLASGLTFFSGFGLGTLLLPAFGLFFPLDTAVALTAVVHLLNNLFKWMLVGKHINWSLLKTFGIPSVIASFIGAMVLKSLSTSQAIGSYHLGEKEFFWYPLNLCMAVIMIFFALMEILPRFKNMEFERKHLIPGGLLSGFFGGLSGHQGALRSAFLVRTGLSKEQFVATGVAIACGVDIIRLAVYGIRWDKTEFSTHGTLLLAAVLAAFFGAFLGNKLLKKVTYKRVQGFVSVFLIIIAILMGMGLIQK